MGNSSYVWFLEALELKDAELSCLSYQTWPRIISYIICPHSWACTI